VAVLVPFEGIIPASAISRYVNDGFVMLGWASKGEFDPAKALKKTDALDRKPR
jgi:hypothetical protein